MPTVVLDKYDLVSKSYTGGTDSLLDIQMINNNNENACNDCLFQLQNDTNDIPDNGNFRYDLAV